MPGLDGTGPQGMGPMTGGGRGYCTGGAPWPYYGRRFGGGVPGTWWRAPYAGFRGYAYDPSAELAFLQQQVSVWRQNVEQMEARIKQLNDQLNKSE